MDGWITIGTEIDDTGFEAQIEKLENDLSMLEHQLKGIENDKPFKGQEEEVIKLRAEIERVTNKIIKLKQRQSDLNTTEVSKFEGSIDRVGDKTSRLIQTIGKWAIALFGIRTAYSFIQRSVNTLSRYNEQIGTDLEYIQFALASTLKPVVEGMIRLVYKLLAYVNYLAKAWFGVNLFANASVDAFNAGKKSTGTMAKNLKEAQKALAGFDEMNVLQENKASADTDANIMSPSMDLSTAGLEDIEIPEWMEKIKEFGLWIKDNWKMVLAVLAGTAVVFLVLKKLFSGSGGLGKGFDSFLSGLGKAAQAIAILGGIALVINQITKLIDVFSQSGLSLLDVGILLAVVLGGIALAFAAVSASVQLMDWSEVAGAAVILAGFALIINQVSNLLKVFADTGLSVADVVGLMASIFIPIIALMGAIALLGPAMTTGLVPFVAVIAGISAILIVMAATLPKILDAVGNFIVKTAPSLVVILTTIGNILNKLIETLGTSLPPIVSSVGALFHNIFQRNIKCYKYCSETPL